MSKVAKVLGIGGGDGGMGALRAQQREQQARIDAANRNTALLEEGQRRARSGGGGFLAFLDDQLKSTFGG